MIRIVVSMMSGLLLMALALPGLAQTGDKLGAGDAVRVTVFQQPDLTTEARISERGMIDMPLVGQVRVSGLSAAEAGKAIGEALKKGDYLKSPQVTVALTTVRSRQVSVLGAGGQRPQHRVRGRELDHRRVPRSRHHHPIAVRSQQVTEPGRDCKGGVLLQDLLSGDHSYDSRVEATMAGIDEHRLP